MPPTCITATLAQPMDTCTKARLKAASGMGWAHSLRRMVLPRWESGARVQWFAHIYAAECTARYGAQRTNMASDAQVACTCASTYHLTLTSRSPHAHLTLSHLTLSHLALSHLAHPPCTPTLPSHPNRSQKTRSSRRLRSPRWWTASAKQRRTRRRSRASSLGTRCWGGRRWEYTWP